MSKGLSRIVKTGIKELNKKIDNLPRGEGNTQQNLTPLQNKIGEIELQSNSNLEKLATMQEDVRKAKNDITNITYSTTGLENSIDELKTTTHNLNGNYENMNNELTSHGESLTTVKTDIHNIKGDIEDLNNVTNDLVSKKANKTDLDKKIDKDDLKTILTEELAKLETRIAALEGKN